MLFIDRFFRERHRFGISIEKYNPASNNSCLSVGLTKKGKHAENNRTIYSEAFKKDFKLFSDQGNNAISQHKLK